MKASEIYINYIIAIEEYTSNLLPIHSSGRKVFDFIDFLVLTCY